MQITPVRRAGEKKDVVFLIDGTTSTSSKFPSIRNMMRILVEKLDMGLDKARVSVVQYSDEPKLEFPLNEFSTKSQVQERIMRLTSKGGTRRNTGRALEWVSRNIYQRSAGSRIEEGVPQFLIVLLGGKSSDDVSRSSASLKRLGIASIPIGSADADSNELRQISSNPEVFYIVNNFEQFARNQPTDNLIVPLFIFAQYWEKDIVFLIDGSASTGPTGFAHVRDFLLKIVQQLNVQPDQVRVGVVQYADRVMTEFLLNSHNNKAAVINAIQRLRNIGGCSSELPDAIDYIMENEFQPFAVARPAVATQHLVIITAGRSTKDFHQYGQLLKSTQINSIAIGAGRGNTQLIQIASTPKDFIPILLLPDLQTQEVFQHFIARLTGLTPVTLSDNETPCKSSQVFFFLLKITFLIAAFLQSSFLYFNHSGQILKTSRYSFSGGWFHKFGPKQLQKNDAIHH
uniref:VWFA domain-containing protein n=1 Tax=Oryzias latipes TaxID=8090 RepID=A0A3P9LKN5_ORYLA